MFIKTGSEGVHNLSFFTSHWNRKIHYRVKFSSAVFTFLTSQFNHLLALKNVYDDGLVFGKVFIPSLSGFLIYSDHFFHHWYNLLFVIFLIVFDLNKRVFWNRILVHWFTFFIDQLQLVFYITFRAFNLWL